MQGVRTQVMAWFLEVSIWENEKGDYRSKLQLQSAKHNVILGKNRL